MHALSHKLHRVRDGKKSKGKVVAHSLSKSESHFYCAVLVSVRWRLIYISEEPVAVYVSQVLNSISYF